ncbi:MAG: IS3 family transposase, partial [Nitrospirales bacterium]|nr:IS3 family transposase [Nitrospirales bacterium]
WQHQLSSFEQAQQRIIGWIRWYNKERPPQALQCLSPHQYRQKQGLQVA